MTDLDKNTIIAVWNDLVLSKRLEDNPYSLSQEDLSSLKQNDELCEFMSRPSKFISTHTKIAQQIFI
jgi:hypothetical protein